MELEISNKKFTLKELSYLDIVFEMPKITNAKERHIKMLELSGIKLEDINNLTAKEGAIIMKGINELNGFNQDFQKTSKSEEQK